MSLQGFIHADESTHQVREAMAHPMDQAPGSVGPLNEPRASRLGPRQQEEVFEIEETAEPEVRDPAQFLGLP